MPTPIVHYRRQQVVTQVITASSTPSSAAKSKGFPVAVAVPALIGGMAVAVAGFLLFWWISKRRRREKRLRWERHQRRQARKRDGGSARPSISSTRQGPSSTKVPLSEKAPIPPVPSLPKHASAQSQQSNQDYGYNQKEYDNYSQQPTIEHHVEPEEPSRPKKSSRSAARVAAADQAAEASFGDPNTRYQPKKPSPLALKAEEKAAGDSRGPRWDDGPFRSDSEYLAPIDTTRQVSGQWGVALGSPNTDAAQPQIAGNDSYAQNYRGKSGMYSQDPYAGYHRDVVEEVDYHQVAADHGYGSARKDNWV